MRLHFHSSFLSMLVLLIGLGTILITILSPRDISMGDTYTLETVQTHPTADNVGRVFAGIILAISLYKIFSVFQQGKVPRSGSEIYIGYLLFFICSVLIAAIVGHGAFDIRFLYAPIILTAVYVTRPISTAQLLFLGKLILLIYIYGSLLAAVLAPSWALMGTNTSILPSVDTRLFGVSSQANQLGPLVAAYIVIELLLPVRSILRTVHLAAAFLVLIWTQSKTSWLFVLLTLIYLVFIKIERALFPTSSSRKGFAKFVFYSLGIAVSMISVAVLIYFDPMNSSIGVESLTGRTVIWAITLNAWSDNPVFGYGLGLWDIDFRNQYGLPFAGQAHNQFIHTLGSSGLVGLFGLLIYLGVMAKRALKISKTNSVALALLFLIVVESMTETPLRNGDILSGFFFLQLLLFAQLMSDR